MAAELEREVENLRAQQRAVADVLRAVRSDRLDVVFDVALEAANRLCRSDFGAISMVDGEVLRPTAQRGGSPEQREYERSHPHTKDRHTLTGRVAVTEQVVHIPDALADPEYSWPGQQMSGYRAMLGAPIVVDDRLIGVIGLVRNEPEPFTDEQSELMTTVAEQAAILRGFTGFVETAEPEELLDVLRSYHALLGELIPEHEGTLEHFAGDGLMVFFNDPTPVEDHELKAIRLALAVQERFRELAGQWSKRGRIGFEGRYDYGALGPVSNLASRLSTHALAGRC